MDAASSGTFNRLREERSPYLRQHARNPVDWHPWGAAAFARARREDKPVFLSVGYSTCHWCHVMARESFEDPATADLLNRHFVAVKVDREERPDVDRVYMDFVVAATGGGGWPMSVWLTPDGTPFLGGTYFPPEDRWGRPGFRTLLQRIADAWAEDRDRIAAAAAESLRQLRAAADSAPAVPAGAPRGRLDRAAAAFRSSYDPQHGGFGGAPKFPSPSMLEFLLRYDAIAGAPDARAMALHTLRAMAAGGIRDHLGGGFHRYAVDARWHVPHFEKMLYDQAQLAVVFLEAFQVSRDPAFARIARGTLDYVLRDLAGPDGGFCSAEDADSGEPGRPGEHAEGAFYLWTAAEIGEILGADAAPFSFRYGIEPEGNVREDPHGAFAGRNVLHAARTVDETAARFGRTPGEVRRALDAARAALFARRAARPRPARDDKILTAWNGLAISAFARAGAVLDADGYAAAARSAADFVRARLHDARRGRLLRRYCAGEAAIDGFLDDYALLIRGLLDLYETGFDAADLAWAVTLQRRQDELFWDRGRSGYFATTGEDPALPLRPKDEHDGAEPAAGAVAVHNLLRLARLTDETGWRRRAEEAAAAFGSLADRAPQAVPSLLSALAFDLASPVRILVAGPPAADDTRRLRRAAHASFHPGRIVRPDPAAADRALARACIGPECRLPTAEPAELARWLEGSPAAEGRGG